MPIAAATSGRRLSATIAMPFRPVSGAPIATMPPFDVLSTRRFPVRAAWRASARSEGACANPRRAGAFASRRPFASYTKRSRSKCCATIGSRRCRRPCRSAELTSAAARNALPAASCSACPRNAFSEREENWDTTIAVETAATSAKAAPSHQRTPMNLFVMPLRLRRDDPQRRDGAVQLGARVERSEPARQPA